MCSPTLPAISLIRRIAEFGQLREVTFDFPTCGDETPALPAPIEHTPPHQPADEPLAAPDPLGDLLGAHQFATVHDNRANYASIRNLSTKFVSNASICLKLPAYALQFPAARSHH